MIAAGEADPELLSRRPEGRLRQDARPTAEAVSEAARKQADDVKAKLMAGGYVIFKGPLKDNKGKAVIAAGTDRGQTDPELEKMNYLVEGVIGATS